MATVVMVMKMIRTYSELKSLATFKERYEYLRLGGIVGEETFGFDRYMNQIFYRSKEWASIRREVIIRDNGCDLGIEDREIQGCIIVHHMNPITLDDIYHGSDFLLNPEYLICTSLNTHNAIHYGDESILFTIPPERTPNDTCPWRRR